MAGRTLLEYVQVIMEDMGSDEVDSISDTTESSRVATILKRTFLDMAAEFDLPTNEELFVLTSLGDTDKPTHMDVPTAVRRVEWIKYDKRTSNADTQVRYEDVFYMEPDDFFNYLSMRNSTDGNVQTVVDPTNINLLIQNDANPTYWTSFDGETVVFDSFDSNVSSTLESSKVVCHGMSTSSWTHSNNAVPAIPEHLEPTFLAIAEERAFAWVKQQENRVTVQNARRGRIAARNDKNRLKPKGVSYPNYGRK